MHILFITLIFALSRLAVSQTSYVAPTKNLAKTGHQIGVGSDYWASQKRVDTDGKSLDFKNGEAFSRIQGNIFGAYGLTENLQVGGGVRMRQNRSTLFNATTNENETDTSTGLESTFVNFIFAFKPIDRWFWTLDATFRYRPFTNEETTPSKRGALVLGDEGNEYSGGLGLTHAFRSNNYLTGRGGYRMPGNNLANEIYWQLEGALVWKHIALLAGADGVVSRKDDPFTGDSANRPNFNTGSTNLYLGENRQSIVPYLGANVALGSKWRVELRGSQVISATSFDQGTNLGIHLIRRSDPGTGRKYDLAFKEYDIEANVFKVSPKKGYVVIDKGVASDVQKGMKIDFFEFDYIGGNTLLASGVVLKTTADTSIVKITHLYNTKRELKEGVIARGSFK